MKLKMQGIHGSGAFNSARVAKVAACAAACATRSLKWLDSILEDARRDMDVADRERLEDTEADLAMIRKGLNHEISLARIIEKKGNFFFSQLLTRQNEIDFGKTVARRRKIGEIRENDNVSSLFF